jgi:peroxiredoxin
LNGARQEIEAHGASLFFIGQATPKHAAHFRRRYAPDVPIFADDERESYKAMKLPRASRSQLVGPKSLV